MFTPALEFQTGPFILKIKPNELQTGREKAFGPVANIWFSNGGPGLRCIGVPESVTQGPHSG